MTRARGLLTAQLPTSAQSQHQQPHLIDVGSVELAVGLRILADLLEAGLPLVRALGVLGDTASGAWAVVGPALAKHVREGRALAVGLENEVRNLPPVVLGLIKAGEYGGGLENAVRRAAEQAEARAATRAALRAALAYPTVVAVSGSGALVVLLGVVLPRFVALLRDTGQQVPVLTRAVLAAGGVIWQWSPVVLTVAMLGLLGLGWWRRQSGGRRTIDRLLLSLPHIGEVRHASATARFADSVAAMLQSGVALRTCLRYAAASVGDAEIEGRLEEARARLDAGEGFARCLAGTRGVTVLAQRLVAAGEESGQLPRMLAYAARLEADRADRLTRSAVRLIEPLMILGFALLVSLVAVALLQALYAVRPT